MNIMAAYINTVSTALLYKQVQNKIKKYTFKFSHNDETNFRDIIFYYVYLYRYFTQYTDFTPEIT